MKIKLNSLDELTDLVALLRCPPPRPRRVSVADKKELGMARFGYSLALPPPGASDVATGGKRILTITVNGVDPPRTLELPGTAMDTGPADASGPAALQFDADDEFSATLQDFDKAGNASPPSAALVVKVVDDVPPPQPGALGVAAKTQLD